MLIHQADRRIELRTFLMRHRARICSLDVGLPTHRSPASSWTAAEEVAESVGVSVRWYELFESGRSDRRFSSAFVHRVADALRLEGRERATLSRLLCLRSERQLRCSSVAPATARCKHLRASVTSRGTSSLRPRLRRPPAIEAIELVQRVIVPNCITVASFERSDALAEAIAVGPRAKLADHSSLARCSI
jgi:transcriptional regulator with XRE-family HTH domain